ncbi:MAG: hypothetical protein WC657_07200 [Candidatus Paceibacterota bacterium]|jgi:hypothetical protein
MTEQSDVEVGGAGEKPTSPVSPKTVDDAETLSKLVRSVVEEAIKPIKGEISGIYSRQDKDRNVYSEFMAEYKKHKRDGLNDEDAERAANVSLEVKAKETRKDALIEAMARKLGLDSPTPVGNGQSGAVDVAQVILETGLEQTDPDVIAAFAGKSFSDPRDAKLIAMDLRLRKVTKPEPSDADRATNSGSVPHSKDAAGLTEEYIKSQLAASKDPQRATLVRANKEKYRKLGVDVDHVSFT